MNFYLTNEHRKYMGLKHIKDNYDLVKLEKGEFHEFYLFFEGNKLVKIVEYFISEQDVCMHERDVNYDTIGDRSIILPKTSRGKERKLTGSVVSSLDGEGVYFSIRKRSSDKYGMAIIGNYTTQKTFFEDVYVEKCSSLDEIKMWCDKFVFESSDDDLREIEKFSLEKKVHCSFKEGDYFRVKLGRDKYTYGRILMDVYKGMKNKTLNYWDVVMGRALIVEVFHILTTRKDVKVEELENLKTFPSQHIMDNEFYYGNYEIIGNGVLPEKINYPIMYGKSISFLDPNKVIFQCGKIHIEKEFNKDNYYGDFRNNSIGFTIVLDERLIEKCLEEKSNDSYWEEFKIYDKDLRNPKNREILVKVLSDYGLDDLIDLYEE